MKDYIQELIDDLTRYKEEEKVVGYELEREMVKYEDGPGYGYGEHLYIKFKIKD